jgi:hypothetical protein
MFERFTDDARKTVLLANQHARALRHSYIGMPICCWPSPTTKQVRLRKP